MESNIPPAPALCRGRWLRFCQDLRALPPLSAGRLLARKASRDWRRHQAESLTRNWVAEVTTDLHSALNCKDDLHVFLDSRFASLAGFPIAREQTRQVAELLRQQFPDWVEHCVVQAKRICRNRLVVLGHEIHLDEPPEWGKDYVNGGIWSAGHSARVNGSQSPAGSDVRFVWELSRFHHGVALGRAFALTGEEQFAAKFVSLFSSWQTDNPPCAGPNWNCAMEVAIRAVNLLWAASLLSGSRSFDAKARETFTRSLLAHGIFIRHHLEYSERVVAGRLQSVNGNHYLADLTGLLHISLAFPEYRHASEWRGFAIRELFRELELQVDDEGVHWEYSPGYHRLVLEMVLACLIQLDRQGVAIPAMIRETAVRMLEFIRHYRKPGGGIPLVRDTDNGRLCILGEDALSSHDHLLALGAIMFERPDLYPKCLHEDCLWYLGTRAYAWHNHQSSLSVASSPDALSGKANGGPANHMLESRLFRQSGFCVMRHQSNYLLALCCPKGMRGFCGHTHNDFLSFELEAYGRTFITDCGSYVYGHSPAWRNRFRSTFSHNTLVVDGCEQNEIDRADLFEIDSCVKPIIKKWFSSSQIDLLVAAYSLRLPDGCEMTHERSFVFCKDRGLWGIRDRMTGAGRHTFESRFHFAEGIEIVPAGEGLFRTVQASGPSLFLIVPGVAGANAAIDPGWVARTYGVKQRVQILRFSWSAILPAEQWYFLVPTRAGTDQTGCPLGDWEQLHLSAFDLIA